MLPPHDIVTLYTLHLVRWERSRITAGSSPTYFIDALRGPDTVAWAGGHLGCRETHIYNMGLLIPCEFTKLANTPTNG